jgi:hypothetical protein
VHARDAMEDRRELRARVLTRDQQSRLDTAARLAHYREAGIMWAQGLFGSCAQARSHFGLALETSNAVRHHYKFFIASKHNESESHALDSFEKSSVPKCSNKSCPCHAKVDNSSDGESDSDVQMTPAHWQTLLTLCQCNEKSDEQIAQDFREQTGVKRSRSAIQKYRTRSGKKMPLLGRPTLLTAEAEQKVVEAMLFMRANKVPIYPMHVAMLGKRISTKLGMDPTLAFGKWWVTSFLKRHGDKFEQVAQKIIEDLRAHYCTASKLRKHYAIVADFLVELGWAKRNPLYDADVPFVDGVSDPRTRVIDIEPRFAHRIVSMDETRFTLNQSKENKGPARSGKRTVVVKAEDDDLTGAALDWGEVVMNKSNYDCTIVGGSSADSNALPALYIFAGGFDPVEDMKGAPRCEKRWQASGELMEACGWHNEKGGMTDEAMLLWLNQVLLPCFPDVSPHNPVVLICDGYGSHLAWDFIQRCIELGVHVILRPPHTSHVTQGEDVQGGHFHTFHRLERKEKQLVTQHLLVSSFKDRKLHRKHVMRITKAAWEEAFSVRVCQHAWQAIGIYPYFDQRPYWEQKAKEAAVAKLKAKVAHDRQQLADAALRIDPADLVIISDDSESAAEDEPSSRKKRRNNSSQFALLGPITHGEALAKRKQLEAERQAQESAQEQQREAREQDKAHSQQRMREAGRAVDSKLVNDGPRWQVDKLSKQDMITLLFYLGKPLNQVGCTSTSKVGDIRFALLQFVANQSQLPYSTRAREALSQNAGPSEHLDQNPDAVHAMP